MSLHVANCRCCELSVANCRTPCAEYHLCHFTIHVPSDDHAPRHDYEVWSPTNLVCIWTHKDYTLSVNFEYSKLT